MTWTKSFYLICDKKNYGIEFFGSAIRTICKFVKKHLLCTKLAPYKWVFKTL